MGNKSSGHWAFVMTVFAHHAQDQVRRVGKVAQLLVHLLINPSKVGKYRKCVACRLMLRHKYSIGLNSGEYLGKSYTVRQSVCWAKNSCIAAQV